LNPFGYILGYIVEDGRDRHLFPPALLASAFLRRPPDVALPDLADGGGGFRLLDLGHELAFLLCQRFDVGDHLGELEGTSIIIGYFDCVLLPALGIFVLITIYAFWKRSTA